MSKLACARSLWSVVLEWGFDSTCSHFLFSAPITRYFAFFEQCANPKACTVLLRGGSKDVLNEIERNLQDAMQVVRNVVLEPRLLPGGGATEMAVANAIRRRLPEVEGVKKFACEAVANALEVMFIVAGATVGVLGVDVEPVFAVECRAVLFLVLGAESDPVRRLYLVALVLRANVLSQVGTLFELRAFPFPMFLTSTRLSDA